VIPKYIPAARSFSKTVYRRRRRNNIITTTTIINVHLIKVSDPILSFNISISK
jgi:hypothetical protein